MKKRTLLLVLTVFVVGGVFALPELKLSAGAGGYFTSDFGGGIEASSPWGTVSIKIPYVGGGGFVFFDATFAELSLGFFGGGGTQEMEQPGGSIETDFSYTGLDIELLGKYPFAISEQLSVFPLLGIKYRAALSVKDEDGDTVKNVDGDEAPGDFSALWFKLGGGVDFSLTEQLYVRGALSYGLRLSNTYENDYVDLAKKTTGMTDPKTLLGHGLEIKVAVGYRF